MLTDAFLDWWFAPWAYAARPSASLSAPDCLGQRDAYRLWCEEARLRPDLPERCDPAWSFAALYDGRVLLSTARLFAGLMAARRHDRTGLDALTIDDRKWCASISATQPLQSFHTMRVASPQQVEIWGLVELAVRLEHGFPGMWSRLRLLLPSDMSRDVDGLLRSGTGAGAHVSTPDRRAQRCWRLCLERVADAARITKEGVLQ
ncbi:MAG TPA: hypothetical protein VEC35_14870 [Noviherbaspirillum sp.]|nr:hypothetical protein [Noviherbaspirillum sp.]